MNQKPIYTRNIKPLQVGSKLDTMVVYNKEDTQIDLSTIKSNKIYISVPHFNNQPNMKEICRIHDQLCEAENFNYFLISNEPSITQHKYRYLHKIRKIQIVSDFKDRQFARMTGTYIYEISALVKSIFVVDALNRIHYVQYCDDLYTPIDLKSVLETMETL